MKVLITGATGLVGKALTNFYASRQIPVNFLTTNKQKLVDQKLVKGFYWNPKIGEIDTDCFDGVTAIINLAGASIAKRWTSSYKKEILASRIRSLSTLHEALSQIEHSKITSFVSASAIGIYPNSLTEYYAEDEVKIDQGFLGNTTYEWEKEIDTFSTFSFKVTKLRIGIVLSAKGGALPKMVKPIQNFVGAFFGTAEQWQSWIHINDLVELFAFAIEEKLEGLYNAVAPNPVTNRKLTREIASILRRPLLLPNIPHFVMKLVLGDMSNLLYASQRVSCKKIEKAGFVFTYTNSKQALESFYHPQNERISKTTYRKEYI